MTTETTSINRSGIALCPDCKSYSIIETHYVAWKEHNGKIVPMNSPKGEVHLVDKDGNGIGRLECIKCHKPMGRIRKK